MTSTTQPTEYPKARPREWIGLAVLALACLLYVMDLTVLHLAVPSISEDLKPSSSQLLWIIDIYGFTVAGFLVTMGTLGDRIGRRKLLLIGAAGSPGWRRRRRGPSRGSHERPGMEPAHAGRRRPSRMLT
jgi:DHA2 family multidrug resistance protein-like MFS transporter